MRQSKNWETHNDKNSEQPKNYLYSSISCFVLENGVFLSRGLCLFDSYTVILIFFDLSDFHSYFFNGMKIDDFFKKFLRNHKILKQFCSIYTILIFD